jgi:hypothetical protein
MAMKWGSLSKFVFIAATLALGFGVTTNSAHAAFCPGPSPTGIFDADHGTFCGGGTQEDWGIPGVNKGVTPYTGLVPAYGLEVSFTGEGPIDPNSILIGNGAGCAGSTGGGTTFCTIGPIDIWEAFRTSPSSIDFLAQSSAYFLSPGQSFFVNVFFLSDPPGPTATYSFITSFSPNLATPLPSTWLMMLSGFVGLTFLAYRGTKKNSAAIAAA